MKHLIGGMTLLLGVFMGATFALYGGATLVQSGDESNSTLVDTVATPGSPPIPGAPEPQTRIDLTARNLAFDKRSITVPAGQQITVALKNEDGGVLHNFSLYTDRSAREKIFVGELIAGPATKEYVFTAPTKAGTYYFRCDAHPETMTGTFNVK
jgi:plastocyanin